MRTVLDDIRDEGRDEGWRDGMRDGEIKGKIEGKIETIQTVASMRFQEKSKRLTALLTSLNDLPLLEQTRQFALSASSLIDLENFAQTMIQFKAESSRGVNEQAL